MDRPRFNGLRILLLGEPCSRFADVFHDLAEVGTVDQGGDAERFCGIWEEKGLREPFPNYDLVVLLATHPGEFSARILRRLRTFAPLLPFLAVLDTWCEGSARTNDPADGVFRLYLHQWPGRGPEVLDAIRKRRGASEPQGIGGVCSGNWTFLPPTAAEEDFILPEMPYEPYVVKKEGLGPEKHGGETAVFVVEDGPVGVDPDMGVFLQTLFEREGRKSRSGPLSRIDSGVTALIADLPELPPGRWDQVLGDFRNCRTAFPAIRFLFFTHSPHFEERTRLLDLGNTVVLSKPFRIKDLLRFLS